jgi:hypothetical protein
MLGKSRTAIDKAWQRYRVRNKIPSYDIPVSGGGKISPAKTIEIQSVMGRYDTKQLIINEINKLPKGKFIDQSEMCRLSCRFDRQRFNRCLEIYGKELDQYRIKIQLFDWLSPKWIWGHPSDIAKVKSKKEALQ